MRIKDEYLHQILEEIRYCIDSWNKLEHIEEKLYYFSSIFGTINRVMNFDCDPILLFIHQVLQGLHQTLNSRLGSPRSQGQQSFMMIPDEFTTAIYDAMIELQDRIEHRDDAKIRVVLEQISSITYAATGNGFFLWKRGKLKL